MANFWATRGHAVTIVTLAADGDFYTLNQQVARHRLGVLALSTGPFDALRLNAYRVRRLRATIRQLAPNVVISFLDQTNVLVLLATYGLNVPVIVSERIDPAVRPLKRVWRLLRRMTYPRATRVVVQTVRAANYFLRDQKVHTIVIPNPVEPAYLCPSYDSLVPHPNVMGMGRLVPQKGFDLLIRAFARVSERHPEWLLLLVGDGPMRGELQRLAYDHGIASRVRFMGNQPGAGTFLGQADLLVLPSRFEGFPNVLCEAMAAGRAVVAFDCPSGPGEIIRHGDDGLLVPPEDVAGLAGTMERLMGDSALRDRLGERARDVVLRFGIDEIMARWEELFRGPEEGGGMRESKTATGIEKQA